MCTAQRSNQPSTQPRFRRLSNAIGCFLAACCSIVWLQSVGRGEEPRRERSLISFRNEVVPILTKAGCNAGTCHAKAGGGQNGFQLSLLGYEPEEDFEHLVTESRGRRLFPAVPDQSLLLLKASATVPHVGGRRIPVDSAAYAVLRTWIEQGMPPTAPGEVSLLELNVTPGRNKLAMRAVQQLQVEAKFSDGTLRDVTHLALYESNDPAMASVTEAGLVQAEDLPGQVSIMVRFQDQVAVYSALIPVGGTVAASAVLPAQPAEKNFIDKGIFATLAEIGLPPSPVCDDATFVRRVTLDIAGRIPTVEEAEQFLADPSVDKREQWIERLLKSPEHADYFANKWTTLLKNRRDDASDIISNFAFHSWIRDSLLANKPYDQWVRELLAATGTVVSNPPVAWYKRVKEPNQQLEDVAQLFLGVRMQCAQCHHHPFERWSQQDYYGLAAFFTRVGRKPTGTRGEDLIFHQRGMALAKNMQSGEMVPPSALGDPLEPIAPDDDPRLKLADWMSSPNNRFFAKAVVNRYWKHFFKRGLIEPEDDIRESNPASHPEVLAQLERHLIEHDFDLRELVRVIVNSNAYQLSAIPNEHNAADYQSFSHYYPERMQAEVLLDSIDQFTGATTAFANLPPGTRAIALPDNSYNKSSPFLTVFGRPDNSSVCECERVQSSSLGQSLHMLNSGEIKGKLSAAGGRAERLANDPRSLEQRVRELYLAAFARVPSDAERDAATEFLNASAQPPASASPPASGPPASVSPQVSREAFEDLIWAMMNTKEFLFVH
jgi:hypothetical protein